MTDNLSVSIAANHGGNAVILFAEATRIDSVVKIGNATAGSGQSNIILYTVYDANSQRVPGAYLRFTATGSAELIDGIVQTDASGEYTLYVQNNVPEAVTITARLVNSQDVIKITTVEFVGAMPEFSFSIEVIRDGVLANNIEQNILRVRLVDRHTGQGIANQFLVVQSNGTANYNPFVNTNQSGFVEVSFTSLVPGK